jgi:hypothetical protein
MTRDVIASLNLNITGDAPNVVAALNNSTLKMDQVADDRVLRDSVAGKGNVIVDAPIIELLEALLAVGNVGVLSLFRLNAEQHGVVEGNNVHVRAVDINSFRGKPVVSNGGASLVELVASMLRLFPESDLDIGFPRPVGGDEKFDASHDVFFQVKDKATAHRCFIGKIAFPLSSMLDPARGTVTTAMKANAARFHLLYPDGLDHVHVSITKSLDTRAL